MIQTATTLEQSCKLLSLGIDPETADMSYIGGWYNRPCCVPYSECKYKGQDMPAWSLAALIAILPGWIEIMGKYSDGDIYNTELVNRVDNDKWHVSYCNKIEKHNPDLFAACIDLIEQLVEQGFIKTNQRK